MGFEPAIAIDQSGTTGQGMPHQTNRNQGSPAKVGRSVEVPVCLSRGFLKRSPRLFRGKSLVESRLTGDPGSNKMRPGHCRPTFSQKCQGFKWSSDVSLAYSRQGDLDRRIPISFSHLFLLIAPETFIYIP
jgi:hypothetical protein